MEGGFHGKPRSPDFVPSDLCMRVTQFPHASSEGQVREATASSHLLCHFLAQDSGKNGFCQAADAQP